MRNCYHFLSRSVLNECYITNKMCCFPLKKRFAEEESVEVQYRLQRLHPMLVLFLDLVLPPSHPTPPRVNQKRPLLKSAQLWKAIFIDFKSKTKAVFLDDAGTGSGNSLGNAKGSKLCFVLSLGIWGQIDNSLPFRVIQLFWMDIQAI